MKTGGHHRRGWLRLGWTSAWLGTACLLRAADVPVALPDSIEPISATGPAADGAAIVRSALLPTESGAAMEIEVALAMRNFPQLLARLQTGEHLSAAEMADHYYPLAADYTSVAQWLTSQGLALTLRDPSRLLIFARGTVAQISAAFQVTMARVSLHQVEYTSAVTPPIVPSGLSALLVGVNGLQTHLHAHKHAHLTPFQPGSTTGNGPPFLPQQIAQVYQADALSQTGAGQTIGIVIDTFPLTADLTSFWAACNVNQSLSNIAFIQVVSGTLPAPSGEETLDVSWSSSIAPAAHVRVYATVALTPTNLDKAYQQIFNDLPTQPQLHVVSLSYGLGELYSSRSTIRTQAQLFANLASAGVTVFVSAGDGGSDPNGTNGHPGGPTQVESPASDGSVTAVGGTSLTVDASTGNETGETAWSDGGGGVSVYSSRPSWQTGAGVPSGSTRCVPDVAAAADPTTGGYLILNGQAYIVGGTSWSAPVWAGFGALINQSRADGGLSSLGLFGPLLYPLLGSPSFRDITSGSNGAYSAGPAYDLCTGLGVPNVARLLAALTPLPPAITAQPQNATTTSGDNAVFSVSATANAAVTYQWQLSSDGGATWTNLTDGSFYSGSLSPTLTVVAPADAATGAQFRCVVSDPSGSTDSSAAVLTVFPILGEPAMPPWALAALAVVLVAVGGRGLARPAGPSVRKA